MAINSSKSNVYLILKIGSLLIALVIVILAIRRLNQEPPSFFDGVVQSLEICDSDTAEVTVIAPNGESKGPSDFPCKITVGAIVKPQKPFDTKISLKSKKQNTFVVDALNNDGQWAFSYQGLVFSSPDLTDLVE